jgi:4'-phosphopantetheinyl transferase
MTIDLTYAFIELPALRREWHAAQHRAGRLLLCDALGCSVEALAAALQYHPNGKPYLPGGPHFNISHSGRLALLAQSNAAPIGCDVEDLARPIRNPEHIRRKIAQPGQENIPLLELWVRYEAQWKAGGPGRIYLPPMPAGYLAAVCSLAPEICELCIKERQLA